MGEDFIMLNDSHQYAEAVGWQAPVIHVDGPCGAPAQNYKDYKVLLLVVSAHLETVQPVIPACLGNCAVSTYASGDDRAATAQHVPARSGLTRYDGSLCCMQSQVLVKLSYVHQLQSSNHIAW